MPRPAPAVRCSLDIFVYKVRYSSTSKLYNKLDLYLKMFFVRAHGCDNAIDTP
jgi:hypothetical protein